jgi:hypothetical protein
MSRPDERPRGRGRYANVLVEIDNLHAANVALRDELRALTARLAIVERSVDRGAIGDVPLPGNLGRRMQLDHGVRLSRIERSVLVVYDMLTPEAVTAARGRAPEVIAGNVREVVLDALRRLQADRINELMTNEDADDGVAEFTDDEVNSIVAAVIARDRPDPERI